MSTCANIYCLFKVSPSQDRVSEIQKVIWNRLGFDRNYGGPETKPGEQYEILAKECGADDEYDFHEDGTVQKRPYGRIGTVISESPREGRFYCTSYLSRWWGEDNPEGPLMEYVVTMLVLLEQADIERVWYADDHHIDPNPVTHDILHTMIDTYIRIGNR